ncbi:MAG: ABC transporter permease, partial [Bowdeniella nasicola]|nr:ABC transporter permease [Bowdeniella nasicola]
MTTPVTHTNSPMHALVAAARFNFRTVLFNPFILGFSVLLPIFMYLMFGASIPEGHHWIGNGNISARVLATMAAYGVVGALSAIGVTVALERQSGWLRQIALTQIGVGRYLVAKLLAGVCASIIIVAVCYGVGAATGARMTGPTWLLTAAAAILGSLIAMAMGLAAAFAVKSDSAFALTSGVLVLSAFMSGMFLPLHMLPDFFQQLAPYTPLYGLAQLVVAP